MTTRLRRYLRALLDALDAPLDLDWLLCPPPLDLTAVLDATYPIVEP